MSVKIILGPPGTGKTTYLLNQLEKHLEDGIPPSKIGFISFTRKAAYEARDRAVERFDFLEEEIPYFRTLHSLAFRQLGLSHSQLMQKAHYLEVADKLGIELCAHVDFSEGALTGAMAGDHLVFIDGLSRIRRETLRQTWEKLDDDRVDWHELEMVSQSLTNYKKENMLYDFTDTLTRCYEEGALPHLDVLFVDEVQDLSALQWLLVERLICQSKITYLAGDDDQAIFSWAGADVEHFINFEGDRTVLNQSYRIPASVHTLATEISSRISNRSDKIFNPRASEGTITYNNSVEDVDLSSGEWLCLARSRRQLQQYELTCKQMGYHYAIFDKSPSWSDEYKAIRTLQHLETGSEVRVDRARDMLQFCSKATANPLKKVDDESTVSMSWLCANCFLPSEEVHWSGTLDKIYPDDADYFIDAFAKGEDLDAKPRIRISTIHGVKGGEADNVAIVSDIYSRVYEGMLLDPDNEHRVFYVGVTRAKNRLAIIQPKTMRFYEL